MRRKRVSDHECPIARCVDPIGDWWSILILRDALEGVTRFDAFQKSLGIAPTILTRRLNSLVDDGLLQRRRYSEHPPRDEYLLTEKGQDFQPVLFSLLAWGNKHFAPEGVCVLIKNVRTGEVAEPVLIDRKSGRALQDPDYRLVCGPQASEDLQRKLSPATTEAGGLGNGGHADRRAPATAPSPGRSKRPSRPG